jgi:hypothetical protein
MVAVQGPNEALPYHIHTGIALTFHFYNFISAVFTKRINSPFRGKYNKDCARQYTNTERTESETTGKCLENEINPGDVYLYNKQTYLCKWKIFHEI